jgi:hypothetical protein
MKTILLKGWTLWRTLKLLLGLFFLGSGIFRQDYILLAGGAYLAAISLFNVGCSGGSCNVN